MGNLSRSYICLEHISLELDDDNHACLKLEHLYYLRYLDEDSLKFLHHASVCEILTYAHSHISITTK
jgi:hypothetical protein